MESFNAPILLAPDEALTLCQQWIHVEGRGTEAATLLRDVLVSLADVGDINLSDLRQLADEQRLWVASLIHGLPFVRDAHLLEGMFPKAA
jgi:hypothetical protein